MWQRQVMVEKASAHKIHYLMSALCLVRAAAVGFEALRFSFTSLHPPCLSAVNHARFTKRMARYRVCVILFVSRVAAHWRVLSLC